MITKIDFIHKDDFVAGTVAASYTNVYNFEYPEQSTANDLGYFVQEPSSVKFKLLYDTWIYTNVYDEKNDNGADYSNYIIKVYDNEILIFLGIIELSSMSLDFNEMIFKFNVIDLLVLINRVSENICDFTSTQTLIETYPKEAELKEYIINNSNAFKFIIQEAITNFFGIEQYLLNIIPLTDYGYPKAKYEYIGYNLLNQTVCALAWFNPSNGARLPYYCLNANTLEFVENGQGEFTEDPQFDLNYRFFYYWSFKSDRQKFAFEPDYSYYYKFIPSTTDNSNSGKIYKIPLNSTLIDIIQNVISIDAPYIDNFYLKDTTNYSQYSTVGNVGVNQYDGLTIAFTGSGFEDTFRFYSKSSCYSDNSVDYIASDLRIFVLSNCGSVSGGNTDYENKALLWVYRVTMKSSGTTIISQNAYTQKYDLGSHVDLDDYMSIITAHPSYTNQYNDGKLTFDFKTASANYTDTVRNQTVNTFAYAGKVSGYSKFYYDTTIRFTGNTYNNYISYKDEEISLGYILKMILNFNNAACLMDYESGDAAISLITRSITNRNDDVTLLESDIIDLEISRIKPELPDIEDFSKIETNESERLYKVITDYYNNYFSIIKDKAVFELSNIFNSYDIKINTIVGIKDRLYKISYISRENDKILSLEATQYPLSVLQLSDDGITFADAELSDNGTDFVKWTVKDI